MQIETVFDGKSYGLYGIMDLTNVRGKNKQKKNL